MSNGYVLDACALIALLTGEQGGEIVKAILEESIEGKTTVRMNKLNLLEVYYNVFRSHDKEKADEMLKTIKMSPIRIIHEINDEVFVEAGRIKACYKVSIADTIALAEALVSKCELLTSDHHEFDIVQSQEPILFHWIR
jgi:predicted nucleic acid-binding protein